MKTLNILVVEDDPILSKMLQSMMEADGHTVVLAPDGLMGLRTYSSGTFDLVITDYHMPNMDGGTMARFIRQFRPEQKIAALTGTFIDDKLLSPWVDRTHRKPISYMELREMLRELCGNPD